MWFSCGCFISYKMPHVGCSWEWTRRNENMVIFTKWLTLISTQDCLSVTWERQMQWAVKSFPWGHFLSLLLFISLARFYWKELSESVALGNSNFLVFNTKINSQPSSEGGTFHRVGSFDIKSCSKNSVEELSVEIPEPIGMLCFPVTRKSSKHGVVEVLATLKHLPLSQTFIADSQVSDLFPGTKWNRFPACSRVSFIALAGEAEGRRPT